MALNLKPQMKSWNRTRRLKLLMPWKPYLVQRHKPPDKKHPDNKSTKPVFIEKRPPAAQIFTGEDEYFHMVTVLYLMEKTFATLFSLLKVKQGTFHFSIKSLQCLVLHTSKCHSEINPLPRQKLSFKIINLGRRSP